MNTHALLNYGIVRSFHDNQKSITSAFLPIVEFGLATIAKEGKNYYDNVTLCEIINRDTGVKIPELTIRTLLKRLEKDKKIKFVGPNHFKIINIDILDSQNYFDELESTSRRLNKFVAEYKLFAKDNRDDEEIKEDLYKFIQVKTYSSLDKQKETIKYSNFYRFLEHINKQEDDLVKIFQDINFGYTLCSLMEKEENVETIKLKDFTIYLDSNFILRLLDLQEECFTNESKELFDLLKQSGAKLLIFEETVHEVMSVLEYYKQKYQNEKSLLNRLYNPSMINGVYGAFYRHKFSISQIDSLIDAIPQKIEELGIAQDKIKRYKLSIKESDIKALYEKKYGESEVISDDYWYHKCENYISIIEIIKWRRSNKNIYPRCFGNSKFIFLTCDWKLYRYNLNSGKQGLHFPEVIIQEAIIDDLMLFFPDNHSRLSTELLVSTYKASQYLSVGVLSDLNNNIEQILQEDSELSNYLVNTTKNIDNYSKITELYNEESDKLGGLKKLVKKQIDIENSKKIKEEEDKRIDIETKYNEGLTEGEQRANDKFKRQKAHKQAKIAKGLKIAIMALLFLVPTVIIILLATKVIVIEENYLNELTKWVITLLISALAYAGSILLGVFWKMDEEYFYKRLCKKD